MTISEKRVYICSPIYGGVDPHFFKCVLKLQQELNTKSIHGVLDFLTGDSAVGRARNALTARFLKTDCTHLLFLDSDLVFSGDQISKLLSHNEPIVGGLYCKKATGLPVQFVLNACYEPIPMRPDGLQEVRYLGTGFICIAREVFEKMIEVYGEEISYKCDADPKVTEWDFWAMGVYRYPDGSKRWLSEDWLFSQRALDLGYKVYADMSVLAKHSGNILYPLDYQEKEIYKIQNFECPPDCLDTLREATTEYDFGIIFANPPTILDIGANTGAFSRFAQSKWPGARIVAYEPNPEIFDYLCRNFKDFPGVIPVNAAVGNPSLDRLFLGKKTRLTCSQYFNGHQSEESIPIRVVPPHELGECDLMKVDVEGAEGYVIENLTKLPHYLLCEYHDEENRARVSKALEGRMEIVGHRTNDSKHGVLAFKLKE